MNDELEINKIILVAHDNYGSREMFINIVNTFPEKKFLLIITEGIYYKKSFIGSCIKLLKEASLIFCIQRFYDMVLFKLAGDTLAKHAKKYAIPFIFSKDINSKEILDIVKNFKTDMLISLYTMHIYKKEILAIPKVAIGTHPSMLPEYRGLEVYFWAMANNEENLGASVFYVDTKVDAGGVIASNKFYIKDIKYSTLLYEKLTKETVSLYLQVIGEFFNKKKLLPHINSGSDKGKYFPMPTADAYKKFKLNGKKYRENGILKELIIAIMTRFHGNSKKIN